MQTVATTVAPAQQAVNGHYGLGRIQYALPALFNPVNFVKKLKGGLARRLGSLAVACIPWFFATECGVLVSQESGLSLIIDADSDDDAETWFQRIEVAYSLDAEVTTSEMLEPGAPIPLVPFQTPAIEDEETLEEIHRLNVERLAAVA